jgi:2-polyprenyl-3-methyl-5-hydroxy-6-metoxy-1,4-benzoquinol methylase
MAEPRQERERLEAIAADSWYGLGANAASVRYSGGIFARHWRGTRCLELGPAEGLMTELLAPAFASLTIVDGSERFCEDLRQRFPAARVIHSLFEHFEPDDRFDTIVLGHVLEHVEDPAALLRRAATWLAPNGIICAAVPNARSVHRQAAVLLGMLPEEHALNATDLHHGHRRVYDPESFRHEFLAAGLRIRVFGGYWLKPLSNAQLDAQWSPEVLHAYMQVGERYPDIAAEIYVIAGN